MPDRWEVERALRGSALPPLARLVTWALLSRADADTAIIPAQFSPSLSALAKDTGMNRASVARHLNVLETAGWVTRLRDAQRAYSDKAPTRYRLHTPTSRTEPLVAQGDQSQAATSRTEQQSLVARSSTTSRTVRPNQTGVPKPDQKKPAKADLYATPGFAEFWETYPRRVAKRLAAGAYRSALSRCGDAQLIIKGAARYRDDPSRYDNFTKHPSTWLNGDCWADDPEPQRSATDRRVAHAQALKAQLRASANGETP